MAAAVAPGNPPLFRLAVEFASRYQPLDDAGLAELCEHYANVPPLFVTTES